MSFDLKKYLQNNPLLKEDQEKDYIEHLMDVRNDFYNKGLKDKAAQVQADIDKLLKKKEVKEEDEIEFTDQEFDPVTRTLSSTVKYLPNFKKAYDDLEDAKKSIEAVASKDELINDTQIKRIKDLVRDAFNKYRTHLRTNYRDDLQKIKTENINRLIKALLMSIEKNLGKRQKEPTILI